MGEDDGARKLTFFDFYAAAIVSNAFVWLWNMALSALPIFSIMGSDAVTIVSYLVYITGGITGAYFLILKVQKDFSKIGMTSAIASWLMSIPLMMTFSSAFHIGLSTSLLFCFLMGGIIASYLNVIKLRG